MGSSIRDAVEALIRKLQPDVTPNTVLVPLNEYYEIKQVPSLILIGPKLEENLAKRVSEKRVERDVANFTYTSSNWPRYYHLDFDLVLTAETGAELLDLQEKVIAFFLDNLEIVVSPECSYYLRELIPLGGLDRPNLSNLRQASGKYRIEDVEVFDSRVEEGKLVKYRDVRVCDKATRQLMEVFHLDE